MTEVLLSYGPWILYLGLVVWLCWVVPARVPTTENTLRDAGRRIAFGAVAVTLVSLPVVYLIASLQGSVFGGEGARWADGSVLLATILIIAPGVYVPLLSIRTAQLWWKNRIPDP